MAACDANAAAEDLSVRVAAFIDHFDHLCRMFRRLGVARRDIEDLAQDVFVVMCRRWSDYQSDRPLRPWLMGIAVHLARRHQARAWRERPAEGLEGQDEGPSLDEQLDSARAQRLVLAVLDALPPRDRALIVLRDFEEMPMHEVARALSVPLFTAYTRLRRARLRFARALEQRQGPRLPGGPLSPSALLVAQRRPAPPTAAGMQRARKLVRGLLPRIQSWPRIDRPPPAPPAVAAPILTAAALVAAVAVLAVSGHPRARHAAVSTTTGLPSRAAARKAETVAARSTLGDGLSGYWRLGGEAGGAVARDLSGGGHDCVLHDLALSGARVDGALGGALDLRGGWLECPRPDVPRADAPLSVSAWVKVTDLRGLGSIVGRQLDEAHRDAFLLSLLFGRLKVRSTLWRTAIKAPAPIPVRRWVHVAFTHAADGTTRLYQDGREVGHLRARRSGSEPALARPIAIGVDINGPTRHEQPLRGAVGEVAVYDRALTPEEVSDLAAGAQPPARR
jgi:RNA polymerase sigma-70 factor (ECF subfamily)